MLEFLWVVLLSFLMNVSFTILSRARNRSNYRYHVIASIVSNLAWFLAFRHLVLNDMGLWLVLPYLIGTATGAMTGARISMNVERWIGADSDSHLKKREPPTHSWVLGAIEASIRASERRMERKKDESPDS